MEKTLLQGEKLFIEGKIEEAEQIFLTLLDQDPVNPQILNNLGVIHCANEAFDQAETCFIKALEADGSHLHAMENLSKLYEVLKKWDKALVYLENCIKITSHNPEFQARRSSLNAKINKENGTPDWLAPVLNRGPEEAGRDQAVPEDDRLNGPAPQKPAPKSQAVSTRGNKQPLVSVRLPVYNGEEFIREAIESILSQDFTDFELIISDNCSTDSTPEICSMYQKMDERIKYYGQTENLGCEENFLHVFEISNSPYFMWASHDDVHEKSFIKKCLSKLKEDSSVALVYPKTKILDRNSKFVNTANDHIKVDQNNPLERFRHLIWELGMCNVFYGLYRTDILRKTRFYRKKLYRAWDNLLLANIALLGKIIQIEDTLFVRRLTRDYNKPLDERNADIMSANDPVGFNDGITFPHCRLTYAHLEIVNESDLLQSEKNVLFNEILRCFKSRFGPHMQFEIKRALRLIDKGLFFYTWNNKTRESPSHGFLETFDFYHINNLLKTLQEAIFIYPEVPEIKNAYKICLQKMSDHQVKDIRGTASEQEACLSSPTAK